MKIPDPVLENAASLLDIPAAAVEFLRILFAILWISSLSFVQKNFSYILFNPVIEFASRNIRP